MADGYFVEVGGDFFRSEDFIRATNYHKEYNSLDELLNDGVIGVYNETNQLYKKEMPIYYDGNTGYITTVGHYRDNGYDPRDPRFRCYLDCRGMLSQRQTDLAINDILTTLGIKGNYNKYLMDTIKTNIDPFFDHDSDSVDAIITSNGIFTYGGELINKIRDIFNDDFNNYKTPIACEYSYTQKVYSNGQGYLVDWDNTTIPDTLGAMQYLNNYNQLNYEDLHSELVRLSENDADLKRIMNCANVRIGILQGAFPTDFRINICGMQIENNNIVTTTESGSNQHYGVLVTHVDWVSFATNEDYGDYPTWHKIASGSSATSSTEVFYNYARSGYFPPNSMIGDGAVVNYASMIDSMGFNGVVKPYETIPNAILPDKTKTLPENYPDWSPENDDDYPVTPDTTIQIFVGIPPINIVYPLPPIINRPIIVVVEVNAPPTDIVVPHNSDYGLFKIYLPSSTVMSEVTGNLWSPSILERIQRIFKNNPMDAVISLHEIYLSGQTVDSIKESTQDKVYFGNVPMTSTANCDWTKQRYIELNFGSLPIKLEFNDYRDYQRDISIFLPFIGFQSLNIMDFTGKGTTNIELKYVCDILTGDVIANLYISKDGLTDNKFMYTYSGNMSSVLPLSANDKSRLFGNVGSALGSVATALVTGGKSAIASSIIGGGTNIATGSQSSVQRSGSISGNTGAMNYKRAFLLINNPRPLDVTYNDLSGYTTNLKARLSSLSGFARVKECHVDTIPNASDVEKNMIESLLKTGVIF